MHILKRRAHLVKIQIMRENGTLTLCVEDDGIPFNPLETKEIELACDIEGCKIGGLGLHLVKKVIDQVCYERCEGKNKLTLTGAKIEVLRSVTRNHPLGYDEFLVAEENLKREIQNQVNGDNTGYETRLVVSSRSTGKILIWFAELQKIDEIIIGAKKKV